MRFDCGQQRVMRLGGAPPGSPTGRLVLTNRMREFFTYGSVGGAGGNPGPYPAGNAGIASRLTIEHGWPGVPEPERLPVKTKQHRQTLRMSLDGIRNGAMFRRPTRPGRRATVHVGGAPRGTDSNTFAAGSAVRRQTRRMEPPGERSLSKGLSPRPAAHPQRWSKTHS